MGPHEVDAGVLESLADKLDGLDLTAEEDLVLNQVLARAANAHAEVEGFGVVYAAETSFPGLDAGATLSDRAARLGRAMGFHIHVNPHHYIGETEKNLRPGGR